MANPTIYTGPAVPPAWIPSWQGFTNLTPAQVLIFQSFPQDLVIYAKQRRWQAEISSVTVGGIPVGTQLQDQQKIAALKQAFDAAIVTSVSFFDLNGNVQTITNGQITAIYTAVVQLVQNTYNTAAQLVANINATPPTITSRAQIDAAYAAIAPNSPSALGTL